MQKVGDIHAHDGWVSQVAPNCLPRPGAAGQQAGGWGRWATAGPAVWPRAAQAPRRGGRHPHCAAAAEAAGSRASASAISSSVFSHSARGSPSSPASLDCLPIWRGMGVACVFEGGGLICLHFAVMFVFGHERGQGKWVGLDTSFHPFPPRTQPPQAQACSSHSRPGRHPHSPPAPAPRRHRWWLTRPACVGGLAGEGRTGRQVVPPAPHRPQGGA